MDALEPAARASFEALAADRRPARDASARARGRRGSPTGDGDRIPRTLSASSLMDHARVPEALLLDARAAAAPVQRTGGADRHRDPRVDRAARGGPGAAARSRRRRRPHPGGARRRSGQGGAAAAGVPRTRGYADRAPLFAERAFLLRVGGFAVGGRIDAIYGEPDGPWEVVDWKTGVGAGRPAAARAVRAGVRRDLAQGARGPDAHLLLPGARRGGVAADGRPRRRCANACRRSLSAIERRVFEPTPGRWCGYCDFKGFCEAGKAWLADNA